MELGDFRVGDAIEMHPATDAWMMGLRFGEVVKVGRTKVSVRLDGYRRVVRVSPENIGRIL